VPAGAVWTSPTNQTLIEVIKGAADIRTSWSTPLGSPRAVDGGVSVGGRLRQQFEVNVLGALRVAATGRPGMRRRGHGRIVNVSSVRGATFTFPGMGAYRHEQDALESMSQALRHELKPFASG